MIQIFIFFCIIITMENMNDIKISVIVPVYNASRYLKQCLDSICSQNFKDYEVICVDDGSTDDSVAILSEYAKKNNRITIVSQEHKGVSAARNTALDRAKGSYIAFIDSDDYVKKNFLSALYSTADDTSADIVACDLAYDKDGRKRANNYISRQTFKVKEPLFSTYQDKSRFVKSRVISNKLFSAKLINRNNIRFVEGLKYGEDTYFLFVASMLASSIALTRRTTYYFRINASSATYNAFNKEVVFDLIKSLDNINSYIHSEVENDDIKKEYFDLFHSFAINMFYSWVREVAEPYKSEFKNMVEERMKKINLEHNNFVDSKTRRRYEKLTGTYESFWNKLAIFR